MSVVTLAGAMSVTIVVVIVSLVVAVPRRGHAERLSRRLGLALPADAAERAEIVSRDRGRIRWIAFGGCLGFIATIAVLLGAAAAGLVADPGAGAPWIGLAGLVLGAATAALGAVLGRRHPADPTRPRVAHARHTALGDYLDPIELVGARVVAILGALATAVALLSPGSSWLGGQPLPATVLAAGGLLGLVLLEVGGRRVVLARPRVADTSNALAWDDATRATELRTLATAPIMMGSYSLVFSGMAGLGSVVRLLPDAAALIVVNLSFFVLVAAVVAVGVVALSRRPEQFYLRRLWPEIAAANASAASTRYAR
jgi:hypothetical protein